MGFLTFLLLAALAVATPRVPLPVQPNIVVFLADDLGYGDLPKYGNPTFSTPHIDQLADEGMLFKTWYSAHALCTPSRAALLTGRHAVRSGMVNLTIPVILSPNQAGGFPNHEISIAQALKNGGYRTGMVGKWHLGINDVSHVDYTHFPTKHGFDEASLASPVGNNNLCKNTNPNVTANPNFPAFCFFMRGVGTGIIVNQRPWVTANLPARLTQAFIDFKNCTHCAHQEDKHKPFFWYHSSMQPHTPLYANGHTGVTLAESMAELDTEVGLLMAIVREIPNTLVFFLSDNGPFLEDYVFENAGQSTAGPFKGGKAQTWEGGHRVPAMAWFPGQIAAGSVKDEMVTSMDIFPTALKLANLPLPVDRVIDGKDMSALLFDNNNNNNGREAWRDAWKDDAFFYFCNNRLFAARWKKFKMHYVTQNWLSLDANMHPIPTSPNACGGECCPLAPNSVAACPCQNLYTAALPNNTLIFIPGPYVTDHTAVPLLFDLEKDVHEDHPLTPDNFADYWSVHDTINQKKLAFEASLVGDIGVPQINLPLINPNLQPFCFTLGNATAIPPIPPTPILPPSLCNYP
jgi:arylsulfatase A-like enzyme